MAAFNCQLGKFDKNKNYDLNIANDNNKTKENPLKKQVEDNSRTNENFSRITKLLRKKIT